jgi:5-methylcytosine-specific restriction protein A
VATERASSAQRGYGSRWQKARAGYLRSHPLCVMCQAHGRINPATVVDHVTPHKGNTELFWNADNWAALCKPCHDSKTAREDGGFGRTGKTQQQGCTVDGLPTSQNHPWNKVK